MANDVETVKTALENLRDVADTQSKNDEPDLKAVAEAWNNFQDGWVAWRVEQLRLEDNPDAEQAEQNKARVEARKAVADKSDDKLEEVASAENEGLKVQPSRRNSKEK